MIVNIPSAKRMIEAVRSSSDVALRRAFNDAPVWDMRYL